MYSKQIVNKYCATLKTADMCIQCIYIFNFSVKILNKQIEEVNNCPIMQQPLWSNCRG